MKYLRVLARTLYANLLPHDLFSAAISLERARQLFATYVRLVEIENHSYCNRTCSFCPNAFLDRRSKTELASQAMFQKIIDDLASIDYSQTLVWARYHEPLADASIFDRVAAARQALPRAFLTLTSNGDYLNEAALRRLESIGLDHMYVSLYLPDGQENDPGQIETAIAKFLKRTGLALGQPVGQRCWRMQGTTLRIMMAVPSYWSTVAISNRGGLVQVAQPYQRTSVCFSPLHHLAIDYNGKAMLCCQVRSDAPEHQSAIIGDLAQEGYGLFQFYRDLAPARAGLFVGGPKSGVCQSCNQNATGPWRAGRQRILASILNGIPGIPQALNFAQRVHNRRRRYEWS